MKNSQFVCTSLQPLSSDAIQYTVVYNSEDSSNDYLIEPRVALHLANNLLIHAQLTENNKTLELRPFTLTKSMQTILTPVKIKYLTSIVSPIVFVDNNDDELYCWLISQNNHIIRHRFTLSKLFNTRDKDEEIAVVRPLPIAPNIKYSSLSATPHGIATVGFVDGSVIHFQEGNKLFPSSSYQLDIVDKEDSRLCSYKLHGTTSFPLLKYLNTVTRYALKWNIDEEGTSTQARTTVLSSSHNKDATVGIRRDHRLVSWTWTNGELKRSLLELPQFDSNGKLVDPEEQDMTYQLPGSFTPRNQAKKQGGGEFQQQKDGHAYDVKILAQHQDDNENSYRTVAYIDTQNEPFFAIYDTKKRSETAVLSAIIIAPKLSTGQFLGFNASLTENNTLRLWTIWQEAKTVFVMSATINLLSKMTADDKHNIIRHSGWVIDSIDTGVNDRAVIDTWIVDNKNILIGASDQLQTIRSLDRLEDLHYHHSDEDDNSVAKAVSTLGKMSISIDSNVRSKLEACLRDSFSKPSCDTTEFYTTQIKANQALNILASFPKIDKSSVTSVLQLLKDEAQRQQNNNENVQQASKMTTTLIIQAIVNIITNRYNILFCLFLVLCGYEDTYKDELLTIREQLRSLDSLRWIPRPVFERLIEPLVVQENARLDVGSAAYYALSKASDVIENCDTLARVGEADVALDMARMFLDITADDCEQGKKGEILRTVKFRSALANHDFHGAIDILSRMTNEKEQGKLLENLVDQAYNDEEYETICNLSLQPQVVGNIIQDRASKQVSLSKRLSWWQVGYSYFTFAKETEIANKCMTEHLKLIGSTDEPLKQFFA
ncbi:hypothetical protein BDC45DRAFT_532416 [Circinella umbellata]|nr:hypothetical protein BDC45DRAFT_532416 [Circinella umbellata]